jgi:ABC-type nitrate/sulfonate/bicarbonate transport system ATPase subunit
MLQQTEEHVHLMMENLFLHNNHWKDKHMVTAWQCGMGMKGWQKLWLKEWSGGVRQRVKLDYWEEQLGE